MSDEPNPRAMREALIDRLGTQFLNLELQITTGIQVLLEANDVQPAARRAVQAFMADVVGGFPVITAAIVELASIVESPLINPKRHGHDTMAGLFAEMRTDEKAGKGEDAHAVSMHTLFEFKGTQMGKKGRDMDMEL